MPPAPVSRVWSVPTPAMVVINAVVASADVSKDLMQRGGGLASGVWGGVGKGFCRSL